MTGTTGDRIEYRDYQKLCTYMARRAQTRLARSGVNMELDDLAQEAAIIFMKVRDGFDPNYGVKFSTYLGRAVLNNLSYARIGAKHARMRSVSIDTMASSEDGDMSGHDLFASDEIEPLERLEREETMRANMRGLSHDARRVVRIIMEPTPEVIKEINRMKSFNALCAKQGMAVPDVKISVGSVCHILRFDAKRRRDVIRSLNALMGVKDEG